MFISLDHGNWPSSMIGQLNVCYCILPGSAGWLFWDVVKKATIQSASATFPDFQETTTTARTGYGGLPHILNTLRLGEVPTNETWQAEDAMPLWLPNPMGIQKTDSSSTVNVCCRVPATIHCDNTAAVKVSGDNNSRKQMRYLDRAFFCQQCHTGQQHYCEVDRNDRSTCQLADKTPIRH
ncbi:hypothetical protein O181_007388 [Austropuccinia psidii MF-1]|uniref:Uncharacterized protein n=1 Tax=Austropuccinia psidii MF-1 TaxID=1389203 RepID=A0A9Q3BM32_9BASI|nr:hypothetical protein [Austropuccinia psidii MF-1]